LARRRGNRLHQQGGERDLWGLQKDWEEGPEGEISSDLAPPRGVNSGQIGIQTISGGAANRFSGEKGALLERGPRQRGREGEFEV